MAYSFTTTYNGMSNVLKNKVFISSAINNTKKAKTEYEALWDTGATCTVITPKVVKELNLLPVSMQYAHTPQGKYEAAMYYIDLLLPNKVVIPKLLVMEGIPSNCDILIGMNVISKGDFAVSNYDGITTFSFRIPSTSKLDFVEKSYAEPSKKSKVLIGRNSKCPCGSGKKYKQCCGKA